MIDILYDVIYPILCKLRVYHHTIEGISHKPNKRKYKVWTCIICIKDIKEEEIIKLYYCDSCGDEMTNGMIIHYSDSDLNFCEEDLYYKSPEELKHSTPIINGRVRLK